VFSTFGVLHVYPDCPAESQSLAEWQREAVLWKAVSSIPFFKTYLIKKLFDRYTHIFYCRTDSFLTEQNIMFTYIIEQYK